MTVRDSSMKFTFDWKEEVSGSIQIEAESGRHAEEIFNSMSRSDLLESQTKSFRKALLSISSIAE